MNLSGLDVVARSDDFDDRAATYELRAWQWNFLHALDGKAELRDVAITGGIDLELALDFVHECQSAALVHVVSMTLDQYRRSIGMTVIESHEDTHDTHDTLGSYESSVPAWMIEHEPEPTDAEDRAEAVASRYDEPVAEYREEPVGKHYEEPMAEHIEETVAEHHDEPVAEHDEEPIVEAHEEPVPSHGAEAIAEHHVEAVAEANVEDGEAAPAEHEEHERHDADPAAYAEPSYAYDAPSGAAATVAGLMSMGPSAEPEAEPALPSTNGHAVSFSFDSNGVTDHSAATNGHAAASSWQPMSLVTSVDDSHAPQPAEPAAADLSTEVPDGISIRLSSHADAPYDRYDTYVEPSAEPHETGSISFSLSADDEAHAEEPAPTTHAQAPAVAHDVPSPVSVSLGSPAPAPAVAMAIEPQRQPLMSPPEAAPVATTAPNATSDIVGSLIARALTFRIK